MERIDDLHEEIEQLQRERDALAAACRCASARIDELETDDHAPVAFVHLRDIQDTLDAALAEL